MDRKFLALVLAAGKGTRFKSNRIKVLHPILGTSMVRLVVDTLCRLEPGHVFIVVGHQKSAVMEESFAKPVRFIYQEKQLGTGHAVLTALDYLKDYSDTSVLIMNGDLPLVRPETLEPFLEYHLHEQNAMTFLTADLDNPFGFGRVVHQEKDLIRIVEEKDATEEQKSIRESNLGIYLFRVKDLLETLPQISNQNAKGEYYLTDVIEIIMRAGKKSAPFKTPNKDEFIGVNDKYELAMAAGVLRERKLRALAEEGVSILDPHSTWIDLEVKVGHETTIYPFVVIEGRSELGEKCLIHPFSHIRDSRIGNRASVGSLSVVESSTIEDDFRIAPLSVIKEDNFPDGVA